MRTQWLLDDLNLTDKCLADLGMINKVRVYRDEKIFMLTVNIAFIIGGMLRPNQEEQYRYFYIDRKLGSANLSQINDALDQIDLILPNMKKIDLINSLVMRMLDLIQTARSFQIKGRIAAVFHRHSHILMDTHSRDQIAVVLAKCIKGSDQYTRITAIQMVRTLPALFVKDTAVYHTLLSKLSRQNCLSKEEKKQAILSLNILLESSKQLSKLLSRNISQLQRLYSIPVHVVIYLLTHVQVDSHLERQIIEETAGMVVAEESSKERRLYRKQIKYFGVLVMKYASYNYRILELYWSKLNGQLPQLAQAMKRLQMKRYPFLKSDRLVDLVECRVTLDVGEFVDDLYIRKQEGSLLSQCQQKIHWILKDAFVGDGWELLNRVLLLYFVSGDIAGYDQAILDLVERDMLRGSCVLFKILATVGCYRSALSVLPSIQVSQQNYMVLRLYLQFKIGNAADHLSSILQVLQILNAQLSALMKMWVLLDQIFTIVQCTGQCADLQSKQQQLQYDLNSLKQHTTSTANFKDQLQVISLIIGYKNYKNVVVLQQVCSHLLPSSLLSHNRFWFAHLNKNSILSLCKVIMFRLQPRG